ncbi:MAG TPA: alpha/beta hydrolase, partial [Gammaproteobacteria bacterium]|nr:alpha/beta hydrolase [Gammaproteobacteria bacterium]
MREHSFISLSPNGFHRVVYSDFGDPENKHVLICVHGLTRNGRDFDTFAEALCDHYRVICPDVP